jgi:hypothetical protein
MSVELQDVQKAASGLDDAEVAALRAEVLAGYLNFRRVPHSQLCWTTIITGAVVLTLNEDRAAAVGAAVDDMRSAWRKRVKQRLPGLRWRGAFEIDLLHPMSVKRRPHKVRLLEDLGVDVQALGVDHRILLPHVHAVMDVGQYRSEEVSEELRVPFRGHWRVLSKPLWTAGTVINNLSNLAGYSTKFVFRYSNGYIDERTKYGDPFESEWEQVVVHAINTVGVSKLTFSGGR